MNSNDVIHDLDKKSDPIRAIHSQRFFKTGPGQYGEGDIFIGVTVPVIRSIASKYKNITLVENQKLLSSPVHEHRLIALIILTLQYQKANTEQQKAIFDYYLKNAKNGNINNWDLVDSSAHKIVGQYLLNRDRAQLYKLAKTGELWQERISVIATATFISRGDFKDILKLSEQFLNHKHDLIHKATGWMLREMGKRDLKELENFLEKHAYSMPRMMLSYSLEKMSTEKRAYYRSL